MSKPAGTGEMRGGEASRSGAAVGIQRWRSAQSWRRAVDKELRPLDLSLTRWLVLHATDALIRASGDAVSQREVAEHADMIEMTVSRVMDGLVERGWVDRGPNYASAAWRVILTSDGERVLAEGRARIEAASARWSAR
jgi:DNA-binding MarR family transcriptional regulator